MFTFLLQLVLISNKNPHNVGIKKTHVHKIQDTETKRFMYLKSDVTQEVPPFP